MPSVLPLLARYAPVLLAGATAFLAGGFLAMRLQRSPVHRQRLGELTIACALLWLVLACLPLPRWRGPRPDPAPPTIAPVRRLPVAPEAPPAIYFARSPTADPRLIALRSAASELDAGQWPIDPPTDAPAPAAFDPREVLSLAYVGGAAACAAWLLAGALLLRRVVSAARPAPPWLDGLLATLDDRSGPLPRLLVSDLCPRPASCGVLRPAVLLPASIVSPENVTLLRQVLLHELGHVRQRDALGNLLLNLALPLLYFHPLYWLVRRDVHLSRELVADDWAASRSGKARYVAELLALARSSLDSRPCPAGPWGPVPLFRSPTPFFRRMNMLLQRNDRLPTRCSTPWRVGLLAAAVAAVATAAGLLGIEPVRAQSASDSDAKVRPVEVKQSDDATDADRVKPKALKEKLAKEKKVADGGEREADRDKVQALQAKLAATEKKLEELNRRLEKTPDFAGPKEEQARKEKAMKADTAKLDSARKQAKDAESYDAVVRRLKEQQKQAPDSAAMDGYVKSRLKEMKLKDKGSDDEFLRRLQLDATQPEYARQFKELTALKQYADSNKARKAKSEGGDDEHEKAPPATGAALFGGKGGGTGIDVVSLALSYVDATGEVRTAEARLKRTSRLVGEKNASQTELAIDEALLETAQRKAKLLRGVIEISITGAKAEYEAAQRMVKGGYAPQSQLADAQAKLQILELILKSGQ